MAKVTYRGVTTKKYYIFGTSNIPTALQSASGGAADSGSYNGETAVLVGDDGSVLRGAVGTNPSTWETK